MLEALQPHILELVSVLIAALIAVGTASLRQWTGIQVSAKHREALHEALVSGIQSAILDGPEAGVDLLVQKGIEHARRSVPDALNHLNPDAGVLNRIANRYAVQAMTQLGRVIARKKGR